MINLFLVNGVFLFFNILMISIIVCKLCCLSDERHYIQKEKENFRDAINKYESSEKAYKNALKEFKIVIEGEAEFESPEIPAPGRKN